MMGEYFTVLCHFFLICYYPDTKIEDVPTGCEGYSAPPAPPFTSTSPKNTYISVRCDFLVSRLKETARTKSYKFNTLHYHQENRPFELTEKFFDGMNVASLVFEKIRDFGRHIDAKLKGKVFDGIQDLQAISFVDCNLNDHWKQYEAFHALTQLQYIYMRSVHMEGIPQQFDHASFQLVKVAEFDRIPLQLMDIPAGRFNKWKNLRMLTIVNSGMKSADWLAGEFHNLYHLDLSNNGLTNIRPGLITPERFPKLKYLNLNDNEIRTISPETLPNRMWSQFNEVYMNRLCCNNDFAWISHYVEKHSILPSFYLLCYLPYPEKSKPEFIQVVNLANFKTKSPCVI